LHATAQLDDSVDVHHGLGDFVSEVHSFSADDELTGKRSVNGQSCSEDKTICIVLENSGNTVIGKAIISSYIENTLQIKFSKVVNTKFQISSGKKVTVVRSILPRRNTGEGKNTVEVFRASAAKGGKWSFEYTFQYHVGSYKAKHSSKAVYRLPYNGLRKIVQAYNGAFSHKNAQANSIDVQMGVGTQVLAPREGIVASIVADQTKSKFDKGVCPKPVTFKCKTKGSEDNHVLIRYSDGTYGYLAHLKHKGVAVKAGQTVRAGQLIGYSGNTGFSKGPHLHVMVNRALPYTDKRRWFFESIRVAYTNSKGKKIIPVQGKSYKH
jgi:murein DD-endopeptidase MepM/ murein hydrolase activator NlpD